MSPTFTWKASQLCFLKILKFQLNILSEIFTKMLALFQQFSLIAKPLA